MLMYLENTPMWKGGGNLFQVDHHGRKLPAIEIYINCFFNKSKLILYDRISKLGLNTLTYYLLYNYLIGRKL